MSCPRFLPVMVLVVLTAAYGVAQTSLGTIAGTVTDPAGAAVTGAQVQAKNTIGSDDRIVQTGANGEYRIDAITPSTYTIAISKTGFNTKEIRNVAVTASVVSSVNARLTVGDVSQTVTVESGGSLIQTDSGELSSTFTRQEVSQLPIVTGNPIDLVLTQPGIVTVASRDNLTTGESFSVDGLRARGNNFLIDGFDNNDYGVTGQALQPANLEAIKEVNIQTNSYAPEFGRGGSSLTNVIYKNGTNLWQGALWERYSGDAINAIPVELKNQGITATPHLVQNQFGFDVGGPIVKNKLFVFGSSQWQIKNAQVEGTQFTIPTAAGVSALQSIGANQNAAILINSLGGLTAPEPTGNINIGNRSGCGSPCLVQVGQVIRVPTTLSRSYEWITRADYTLTEKDTVSGRYIGSHSSLNPDLFANPAALPTQDTSQGGPSRTLGVYWTHLLSPTKVNEFRFTAQQINFSFTPLPSTTSSPLEAFPNITIPGLTGTTFGGLNPNFPQGRAHDTYQYQDAFSWAAGNHSFKVGADVIHISVNDTLPFNLIGAVSIAGGGDCSSIGLRTCTPLANFIDNYTGPTGQYGRVFGSPFFSFPQTLQSYYFQDSWKLRPNLTLTWGLRYEYQGAPLNALPYPTIYPGLAGAFQPETQRVPQQPDKNNFGPRAGLAFTPHGWNSLFGENKTVFRAGFGTFYDILFSNIGDNIAAGPPAALGGTFVASNAGRGAPGAVQLAAAVPASLNPLLLQYTAYSNLVNPLIYQWNFNVERSLPSNFLFRIAYVGTRGERLFLTEDANPKIVGVNVNPARGSILARTNFGNSTYNGLAVSVERSVGRGLMVRGAYTWSKALDNGSDILTTSGGTFVPQNEFNSSLEKGPSAFDRRQRAVITWIYTTPRFKGSNVAKALSVAVSDWQISGIFSFQTGAPETVYINGYNQNGDSSTRNDRPNLSNPNAPINYSASCLASTTCISGVGQINPDGSLTDWWSGAPGTASQFRYIVTNVQGIGPDGNLGRNTLTNPGRQDYEMALTRVIRLPHWENQQLEFRAEAYNTFNHPNAGGGTTQDGSTVPGISGNLNGTTFLNKDITYEGGRSLQLWLKYRF